MATDQARYDREFAGLDQGLNNGRWSGQANVASEIARVMRDRGTWTALGESVEERAVRLGAIADVATRETDIIQSVRERARDAWAQDRNNPQFSSMTLVGSHGDRLARASDGWRNDKSHVQTELQREQIRRLERQEILQQRIAAATEKLAAGEVEL
jgi:hypothetical protein